MAKQVTVGQIKRFIESEIAQRTAAAKEATDIKVARIALRGTILAAVVGVAAGVATPLVQAALKDSTLEAAEIRKSVNEALKEKETTIILLQNRIAEVQKDLDRARADVQKTSVVGQQPTDLKPVVPPSASPALDEALKKTEALRAQGLKLAKGEVERLENELVRLQAALHEAQQSSTGEPGSPPDPGDVLRKQERIQGILKEIKDVDTQLTKAREDLSAQEAPTAIAQPAGGGAGTAAPKSR